MRRYVAASGLGDGRRAAFLRGVADLGFATVLDSPTLIIAVAPGTAAIALGERGVVLGELFAPGVPGPLRTLSPSCTALAVTTQGQHLSNAYWGNYVGLLDDDAGTWCWRAPFGDLPVLLHDAGGAIVVASDVPALEALTGYRRAIDYDAVAEHLVAGDLKPERPCLAGLVELRGGERVRIGSQVGAREQIWSPWRFTVPARALNDRDEAERQLRDQARHVVDRRSTTFAKPLLLLSGGLDSSLVAASLAAAGRPFAALTVATVNASGDEREYARMVAAELGFDLAEGHNAFAGIDLLRSTAADLPRPMARGFEQDADRLASAAAKTLGCDAILDGGGGDNVFCSLQSATPAADCLLSPEGRPHFWRMAAEIGAIADASRWRVAWRAWRRAHRRERGYRWPADRRFLTLEAAAAGVVGIDHPWLAPPGDVLPGRAAHAALLIPAQGLVECGRPASSLPVMSPLISQPLVETCLRIPSWHWFERGSNRAAARRAFAGLLPAPIVWRRSKGTPDSFLVELLDANRPTIRETLIGGALANAGIIDRTTVANALDDPRPARGHDFARLMQLVDYEAWMAAQSC